MINKRKEFGDYQTPPEFCEIICNYLKNRLKINPDIIVEPTCGIGNFLTASLKLFSPEHLYGIEINPSNLNQIPNYPNLKLINEDIFKYKFNIKENKNFLIIGNPPWVTNTDLSKLNSKNLPVKSNFKNKTGMEALTGSSNFDISESIILKMIDEFKNTTSTFAFLCKTGVARNIFKELNRKNITCTYIKQLNFNAKKIFNIDSPACLLVIKIGLKRSKINKCSVSNLKTPDEILYKYGFREGKFYSNLDENNVIDGECIFKWRSGVKHDCSSVVELECENNHLINKQNQTVDVESDLIYPLLKTSALKKPVISKTDKYVIITQQKIRQDTSYIENECPRLWEYLNENREFFDKRKSSIYNNSPDFSMFGIGDYSFKKYKVAVSGFLKDPIFCLVHGNKAVMLDDTCYFISFDSYNEAYITMLILNTALVKNFLKSIVFPDAKRPYTKKVLKRVDIVECLEILTLNDLKNVEKDLNLKSYVTQDILKEYIGKLI